MTNLEMISCRFYNNDYFRDYYRVVNRVLGIPSSLQVGRKGLFHLDRSSWDEKALILYFKELIGNTYDILLRPD
jgi:hypothetical protein